MYIIKQGIIYYISILIKILFNSAAPVPSVGPPRQRDAEGEGIEEEHLFKKTVKKK